MVVKTYAKKHRPNLHLNIHKDRTIALTCSLLSRTCIPQKPWVSCLSIAFRRSSSGLVPWPCSHACPLSPQTVETTCAQICLSVYLSIYLPTYVSIYPSIYCGWKKSEASWPLAFLIIYRVSTIQGGGGFLPSTESTYLPIYLSTYLRIYLSVYQPYLIPVVPHKAVGEVSKIGNL